MFLYWCFILVPRCLKSARVSLPQNVTLVTLRRVGASTAAASDLGGISQSADPVIYLLSKNSICLFLRHLSITRTCTWKHSADLDFLV